MDTNHSDTLSKATRLLIDQALREDCTDEDITTRATVPEGTTTSAEIISRESGVLAGTHLLPYLFEQLDGEIEISTRNDGYQFAPSETLAELKGSARALLSGERTALNFLQRLTGVATLAHRFASEVRDFDTEIVDTRKTTPGWRSLEKYAVRQGGATNHRMNLSEMAIIKENHLAILEKNETALGEVVNALQSSVDVQVEVDAPEELSTVLQVKPDLVLLDNMSTEQTEQAVSDIRLFERNHTVRIRVEASGGITLDRVRAYARTGVDRISVGSMTHSARSRDLSMMIR